MRAGQRRGLERAEYATGPRGAGQAPSAVSNLPPGMLACPTEWSTMVARLAAAAKAAPDEAPVPETKRPVETSSLDGGCLVRGAVAAGRIRGARRRSRPECTG